MRKINSLLTGFFLTLILLQANAQNNELANFTTISSGTTVHFTNTSNTPPGDTAMRRCLWLFGDGSSLLTFYSTNPTHTYAQFGTYQPCLKLFKRVPPTTPNGDTLLLSVPESIVDDRYMGSCKFKISPPEKSVINGEMHCGGFKLPLKAEIR